MEGTRDQWFKTETVPAFAEHTVQCYVWLGKVCAGEYGNVIGRVRRGVSEGVIFELRPAGGGGFSQRLLYFSGW